MYSTSVTILISTLAVILLSARHYQIASDYSGQVARALCNQQNLLLPQIWNTIYRVSQKKRPFVFDRP